MKPWEVKAHALVAMLCRASFEAQNRLPNGKLRKKHRPYSVPETAQRLIECLNRNDEETAKALFLFNYDLNRVQHET